MTLRAGWKRLTEVEQGSRSQDGQQILDRALDLGAVSASTARSRAELDTRRDPAWSELLSCGYLCVAAPDAFYLANLDGSAERMFGGLTRDGASNPSIFMTTGAVLLVAGLLGHIFAAQAIGGTRLAYRDHILGFVGLTIVSGGIIAAMGWRFWKGRRDITLLILGTVQALIGLLIYMNRFSVHG